MARRDPFRSLLFLSALCAASCARIPDAADAPPPRDSGAVVLRLAEALPEEHPSARAGARFAELVRERSGGRIGVKVYYGGSLGAGAEVIAQLQFGGIAMGRINALELAETVPDLRPILEPSALMSGEAVMAAIERSAEPIADACLREKLVPLVFYYPDIRCVYSDEIAVRSAAAFRGLRIGVGAGAAVKHALDALGAVPVDLISADTYKSLRTGYIQARESTFSELVLSDDYPFVRHLTLSRYIAAPDVILISPEVLNELSSAERRMIAECARDSYSYQKRLMDAFHIDWISRLAADGKDVFWEDERFKADVGTALAARRTAP